MKTELKYRTFDQLLDEVSTDFYLYNNEGMIEPGQLIKVVQRVNYDLGLRIHGTKEKILDISHRKCRLPDDFYVLNYALLCGTYKVHHGVLHGRHTEDRILDPTLCRKCELPDPDCTCEKTYTIETNTGENIHVQVVEKRVHETRIYEELEPMQISQVKGHHGTASRLGGYFQHGYLYTPHLESGRVYLHYQGALEDLDGNLLVLDHPLINEYYEYALKQRILENLFINGEDVGQKMQLVEQRYKLSRNTALGIVNTPDFAEMQQLWETNRKAMYGKYYDMFKSTEGI